MSGNRNFIVAIALSLAVLFTWQYFIAGPQLELQRKQAEIEQAQKAKEQPNAAAPGTAQAPNDVTPSAALPGVAVTANQPIDRTTALKAAPRVAINTDSLAGSIDLLGGRIDDLALKHYHETIDPKSPNIELFSPVGTAEPYFAEFGWVADPANPVKTPTRDTVWTQDGSGELTPQTPVTLSFDNGEGWVFKRTFAVDDKYVFTVTDAVENTSGKSATVTPYAAVERYGTPKLGGNWLLHEGLVGILGTTDLKEEKLTYKDIKAKLKDERPKQTGGWVGFVDKYWAAALIPEAGKQVQPIFAYQQAGGSLDTYQTYLVGDAASLATGATAKTTTHLFAGAKEVETINFYRDTLGVQKFDLLIDWGWFWFLTKPMFWLLSSLAKVIGNFGIAILVTTVILKLIFFPLANKSYESMSKMKKLQPEMKELQERFADDKTTQQQEIMQLYKRHKVNPVSGCLPVALQIPVFFSLYKVLYITIEMRHAPFYGWIHDLAAPDPTSLFNLFGLLPFSPPQALMIGVWPLVMGATMFVQMKLNPAPPDPTQKMLFTWMPLIFMFTLSNFPAGLVIYWAWNNTLSILQQAVIMKKNGVKIELWDNMRDTFAFLARWRRT
ncbi:MAG: membrane protein insertase YidC [Ancalomicrobiaceae bacterium]|nr:membrane protein insertase YidC [Ancalomicrobiaceae bacterium]